MKILLEQIQISNRKRKANQEKVKEISESIKEIGLLNPITITKENKLIAGLHRVEAYKLLGFTEIECNVLKLKDSLKLELAEIDENLIRNELSALVRSEQLLRRKEIYEELYPDTKQGGDRKSEKIKSRNPSFDQKPSFVNDTSKKTGKSETVIKEEIKIAKDIDQEVKDLIYDTDIEDNKTDLIELAKIKDKNKQKEIIEKITSGESKNVKDATKTLDKEKLKEEVRNKVESVNDNELIQVIQGDCLDELRKIESNSIDLIITDPPQFGIVKDSWDNQWNTYQDYLSWCKLWISELSRVIKDTGNIYIWCTIGEKSDMAIRVKLIGDESGLIFKDWITWKKRRGLGNKRGWLYTREEILWFCKSEKYTWNEDNQYNEDEKNEFTKGFSGYDCKSEFKRITNVWDDIPEELGNKNILHSTPKPMKAIERIILSHTYENDLVLDIFGGSGTTAVCSKNLKRRCIIIDKEQDNIDFTRVRLDEI